MLTQDQIRQAMMTARPAGGVPSGYAQMLPGGGPPAPPMPQPPPPAPPPQFSPAASVPMGYADMFQPAPQPDAPPASSAPPPPQANMIHQALQNLLAQGNAGGPLGVSATAAPLPAASDQQPVAAAPAAPPVTSPIQGDGAHGEIRVGADGKKYQYIQMTGGNGGAPDAGGTPAKFEWHEVVGDEAAPTPHPRPIATPKAQSKAYTVKAGDTLWDIARRNGTTVGAIAKKNHIKNPNLIKVGLKIHI